MFIVSHTLGFRQERHGKRGHSSCSRDAHHQPTVLPDFKLEMVVSDQWQHKANPRGYEAIQKVQHQAQKYTT